MLPDILDRDDKVQEIYIEYVTKRLLEGSEVSIWEIMKKIKLTTYGKNNFKGRRQGC